MVWIYGGAWKIGSADQPGYEAGTLAGAGVVVVTFNYRIGFDGFGQLSDEKATRITGLLAAAANVPATREGFATLSAEQILAVIAAQDVQESGALAALE
jgi:para-nitrobenzyl esterase